MNNPSSAIDIQEGDTIVGTKKMVMARIHALSRLQQKDASVRISRPKKVSAVQVDFAHIYIHIKHHSNIDILNSTA